MGEIIKFPSPEDRPRPETKRKALEEGKFYDLRPPSNVQGEIYDRVQCEYQVPGSPDEYVVRGVPRGETKIKSFVLRFTSKGGVVPSESKEQNFGSEPNIEK